MDLKFARESYRPAFTSAGFHFIIKPKFPLDDNLAISFEWEIKCLGFLPPVSLKAVQVKCGKHGKTEDVTENFILPDKLEFPEVQPAVRGSVASLKTRFDLRPIDIKKITFGNFSLVLEMEFLGRIFLLLKPLF